MPSIKGTTRQELLQIFADESKTETERIFEALMLLADEVDALEARQ